MAKDGYERRLANPSLNSQAPAYRYYHAEPFVGPEESCWEKHQMEKEMALSAA
jgi:hypothetical protein